jgi:serine/threonine protein kinase
MNHYIHRDIKPSNFVLGRKKAKRVVYLIDFGIAKIYRDRETLTHVAPNMRHPFIGTT